MCGVFMFPQKYSSSFQRVCSHGRFKWRFTVFLPQVWSPLQGELYPETKFCTCCGKYGGEASVQRRSTFSISASVLKLLPRFWSQVSPGLIAQLAQPWAYQADFEMFNYSVAHYLHTIGYSRPDMQNSQLSTLMFLWIRWLATCMKLRIKCR